METFAVCVCVCSTSNNSWSKGLKHVSALHACMSTIRLGMSVFRSHVREGLLNSVWFCSSHCECLCGEFGFALLPHHLRVHAVATLKHISIFCEVRVSCGNIYLTFSLFGCQGLRALQHFVCLLRALGLILNVFLVNYFWRYINFCIKVAACFQGPFHFLCFVSTFFNNFPPFGIYRERAKQQDILK